MVESLGRLSFALLLAAALLQSADARPQATLLVSSTGSPVGPPGPGFLGPPGRSSGPIGPPGSFGPPGRSNTLGPSSPEENEELTTEAAVPDAEPVISQFLVRSDVQFRYARTRVESYVKNPASVAQKLSFSLVMPDTAFVSNFSMLVGDEEFVAEVKEKEEAKEAFDDAVQRGRGAGMVEQDARDANLISVSVNVEPGAKVRFALTYEELLQRKLGRYEHVIHLNPGQIVDSFRVDVDIDESLPVERVRVPKLKVDPNSITSQDPNPLATVERDPLDPSKVKIRFEADRAAQKELSGQGVSGQFIVQYDVDGQGDSGDIQLLDGYFVHFFSPDQLETLPKHVVFVLDVSGSMHGPKLDQTKDAMVTVLDDMTEQDYFNIITFSDNVYHWSPESEKDSESPHNLTFPGTQEMRDEALTYALGLRTIGGTNINDGMLAALELIRAVRQSESLPANVRPIVIFLTDGEPTTGVTDGDKIMANVVEANQDLEVPVYGLAFGHGADFGLIKKLSLANNAFARRIYEGSDAAIQLEDFYAQIASPLLADVEFDYVGESIKNKSLTKTSFGTFNRGNEFVVAGKIDPDSDDDEVEVMIKGNGVGGHFEKRIKICLRPMPIPEMPVPLPNLVVDDVRPEDLAVFAGMEDDRNDQSLSIPSEDDPRHDQMLSIPPPPRRSDESPRVKDIDDESPRVKDIIPPFRPFPDRCFPLPPPKPREPRSEHENFIERLWAFMSVKELLEKDKTETQQRREELTKDSSTTAPEPDVIYDVFGGDDEEESNEVTPLPGLLVDDTEAFRPREQPEKTNKEKAVELALEYNFVTPVTSLVVVRPDENVTETIEPVPVSTARGGGFGGCPSCYSAVSFRSAPRPMMHHVPMTVARRGGGGVRMKSPSSSRGGPGLLGNVGPPGPPMHRLPGPPAPPPPRPTTLSSPAYDYDAPMSASFDYDAMYDVDEASDVMYDVMPTTTTTTPKTTCSGKLTLYSKTYRRGDSVEILSDVMDLADLDFDNRLKSLEVEGDCCWQIFVDARFGGESMSFTAGPKDSAIMLIKLVNKASSVRMRPQC